MFHMCGTLEMVDVLQKVAASAVSLYMHACLLCGTPLNLVT